MLKSEAWNRTEFNIHAPVMLPSSLLSFALRSFGTKQLQVRNTVLV